MRLALRTAVLGFVAAAIAGAGCPAASAAGRGPPTRIMSLNVCTDLLLLEIAPKARIASVTFLAPEAARALFPGLAAGIPLNHGSAEDVVKVKPDLILESGLSSPLTGAMARRVGARVVDVKDANSFAGPRITCDKTVMPGNSACHAGLLFFEVQNDGSIKALTHDFVSGVL